MHQTNPESYPEAIRIGEDAYRWASDLFPICRSLTGPGVRKTLEFIKEIVPDLKIHAVPSGTKAFDWTVPDEWTIRDAYVADSDGNRVIDFRAHNLHVVGYSEPVDRWVELDELQTHLHSLPELPDAIPYVTSYYERRWGFCLSHRQRQSLKADRFHVVIDSDLQPGVMNYGELILPGREEREVLLSTYICHPSMANNELSGPVLTAAVARELSSHADRRLTYRIVFAPETIGSIVYISRHLRRLKEMVIAGFIVTCVGDERGYSFLRSRLGDTLADRVIRNVLKHTTKEFDEYSFLERGSDERQYCSPHVDLPMVAVMRSKFGCYPEYHTSLDNLSLITPAGLAGSYRVLMSCLAALDKNRTYRTINPCEPMLGPRGLYPTLSTRTSGDQVRDIMNVIAYADGQLDLVEIAEIIGKDVLTCATIVDKLHQAGVLEVMTEGGGLGSLPHLSIV
jgi:aminopeptidase-like protein